MLNTKKYIFKLLPHRIVGNEHDRIYLRNSEHSVVYCKTEFCNTKNGLYAF